MHCALGRGLAVDLVEEADELLMRHPLSRQQNPQSLGDEHRLTRRCPGSGTVGSAFLVYESRAEQAARKRLRVRISCDRLCVGDQKGSGVQEALLRRAMPTARRLIG